MKIKEAEFIKSAPTLEHCPTTNFPEFAFAGRSNVGKSSLINYLTHHKKLARTSSEPGRTRMLNYYLINKSMYFVDLPGYGYAKVSRATRNAWQREMKRYLSDREQLRAIIQVVDIRHDAGPLDLEMAEKIREIGVPWLLVVTKADKISKSSQQQQVAKIAKTLGMDNKNRIFLVSSEKQFGEESLLNELAKLR